VSSDATDSYKNNLKAGSTAEDSESFAAKRMLQSC